MLNYAKNYYGLQENPCHKAGSMGKKHAKEKLFWTKNEYLQFSESITDRPRAHIIFQLLYWCGIREGELLALSIKDIDFEEKVLTINKSYQRINGEDIITEPKTPKGNRIIALPDFLCDELKAYFALLYNKNPNTRIFDITKSYLYREMNRGAL